MDRIYLAAVGAVVPGLGLTRIPEAIAHLGSAEKLFYATGEELEALGLFSQRAISNFLFGRKKVDPAALAKRCQELGIQIISYFDPEYPASLKEIHNPPMVLYVMGCLPKDGYHIAIVGSRLATAYGLKTAKYFAKSMVAGDTAVISGGAAGIDAAAHAAVLEENGVTVAVLGCGVDIVFPQENRQLFQGILKRGALVSEYPPGTPPRGMHFPARNRIIVGLSRGVIVCEAAVKSGALITARQAVDEQREVYCVPGSIFVPTSVGCHEMIKQGAKLISDARDIFLDREDYYLKIQRGAVRQGDLFQEQAVLKPAASNGEGNLLQGVSEKGRRLYEFLSQGPMSLDSLLEASGLDFTSISMEMLDLQVLGLVDQDQAQRYYRV
ncbi:MAG: DNA-processing protein DprA [Acidaminococcaceae bacterium]|nr:DNA-processing protein DprA [Acidaminococcaceae bacterium]